MKIVLKTLSTAAFALALGLPTVAQETPPDGQKVPEQVVGSSTVVIRSQLPLSLEGVRSVCSGQDMKQVVRAVLGDLLADKGNVSMYPQANSAKVPPEGTTLSFALTITAQVRAEVPAERQDEVIKKVLAQLERRIDKIQRQDPSARDRERLDALTAEGEKLEAIWLDLRKRGAVMPHADLQGANAIASDLEKQRLNVELDLRTEEGVQQHLQELQAAAQKRADAAGEQCRRLNEERSKLQTSLAMQRSAQGGKSEENQQIEQLSKKVSEIEIAYNALAPEASIQGSLASSLAEEARKSALTVNRLATRFQLLEKMIAEQHKVVVEAEVASAERDAAMARADDVRARMQALRQRVEELRARLDAIEPVRIEIWK
jgi:chromosome segregation ATPase